MSIVFFCQSCGSRFNIDPRMAGKQGRCKKCGVRMTVPRVEDGARKAAKPELAAVAVGGGKGPASSWIGEVDAAKVALEPLTIDRMPGLKKPAMFAEDDEADSNPYDLAEPLRRQGAGRVESQVSGFKIQWRRQLGKIERVFRWINQASYLVSVPFVMVLLLGIMIRSHATANVGAVVVVALNIARLISGAFNLAVIPFRDGINWKRLKKPLRRVIEPAVTIGLVAAAFALFPWLSYKKERPIVASIRKFGQSLDDVQAKARALGGGGSASTKQP